MSDYVKECETINRIVELIKGGDFGTYKKVSSITHYYNEDKRQTRAIIKIQNPDGEVLTLNLLAALLGDHHNKQLYINRRSYEYQRDGKKPGAGDLDAQLAKLCDP